jgi:hypothetical protein
MYAFLLHVSLMFAHSRYSFPLNVWICGEVGNLFAWRWSVTVVVTVSSFENRIHGLPRGNVLSARLRVRVSAGSGSVSRRVPGSGLVKTVVDSARPPASTVIEGNLLPIERSTVISGALSDIVVFTPCAVKGPLAPRPRQPLARARRRQPEGGPPPDSRDCDETPSKGKVRVGVNFATKTVTVVDPALLPGVTVMSGAPAAELIIIFYFRRFRSPSDSAAFKVTAAAAIGPDPAEPNWPGTGRPQRAACGRQRRS